MNLHCSCDLLNQKSLASFTLLHIHERVNKILFFSGYGKTISHVIIGLKTSKGTKQLKLDPSVHDTLLKQKIEVGDVIYIEANSGAVKVCIF